MGNIDRKNFYFIAVFFFLLLIQFNNCNSINSQKSNFSSTSSDSLNNPASVGSENIPVDPTNPYVLQCIKTSDGIVVSPALKNSVINSNSGGANKISFIDWAQDEDLIVTLENNCVAQSNYTDPMLQYVQPSLIRQDMPFTVYIIKKESVTNLKSFIDTALSSECLISAEKNQNLKINADISDPKFDDLKHLLSIGATEVFMNSILSYNSGQLYKTKVAVIDTGVDVVNPDLIEQLAKDSAGKILGYNSTGNSTEFTDIDFHGTHVTGLIAAGFHNGVLGSGIWGRNIEIYPVRAFQIDAAGDLTATASSVANAILWAVTRNVDLINLSLGSTVESLAIRNAISFAISKNITFVVAAGNDGLQLSATNPQYPAMLSNQFNGLITVGSLDVTSDKLSSFSNYSSTYVDILAPGSNSTFGIASTVPISLTANGTGFGSKITSGGITQPIQGTSMSAPIVTGALAAAISLSNSRGVKFTNAELETFLTAEGSLKNASYSNFSFRGNYLNFQVLINFIKTKIDAALAARPAATNISITKQPANKQVIALDNVELNVEATSDAQLSYQWYYNSTKIVDATTSKLPLKQLKETQAGAYYVIVSSGTNTVTSRVADVKVALKICN